MFVHNTHIRCLYTCMVHTHTCAQTHSLRGVTLKAANHLTVLFMGTNYIFLTTISHFSINSVFKYTQCNSVNLEVIHQKSGYLGS